MALIGGQLGYSILRSVAGREGSAARDQVGQVDSDHCFGDDLLAQVADKEVIDFGCGAGQLAVELAEGGAKHVIGIDIQEKLLRQARDLARSRGVEERCTFSIAADRPADVILSKDAFEHFRDPARVLREMHDLLKPGGYVLASFGPIWLHPRGGHLFSVFPWAHLIFSEKALIKWRSDFKSDGARSFGEVEGGLNQMTIRRFEHIVAESPFHLEWLDTVPVKGWSVFKHPALREFFSSIVRCKLRRKVDAD